MKTYLFGLVCLGLTNLMFAQNDLAVVDYETATYTTTNTIAPTKAVRNVDYLTNVDFNDTAMHIKILHKQVADFDITTAKFYDPSASSGTYSVEIKEGENKIDALYDHNGTILSCSESFQNIRLPYRVASKVAYDYPGWSFNKTWCNITYANTDDSKITYKIELKKDNKTKMVKIAQ